MITATMPCETSSFAGKRFSRTDPRRWQQARRVSEPDLTNAVETDPDSAAGHQLGTSGHQVGDSRREKTLGNVGIPRVFFVAGAGFEPATFGL